MRISNEPTRQTSNDLVVGNTNIEGTRPSNLASVPLAIPATTPSTTYNARDMPERRERLQPTKMTHLTRFGPTEEMPNLDDRVTEPFRVQETPKASPVSVGIARNTAIVGIAFVASRVLGLVREIVIAAQFGTSPEYSAYVAAFRIPDLLFLLVMSGAFGSAFIPVFAGLLARQRRSEAWQLASTILTYVLIVLLVSTVLIFLVVRPLIDVVIAPGLPNEQAELAAELTRMLLLSPLLLGLGIAFKGMLEAQERFALSAFAPVFYNLGIIFGAVALVPFFGIHGLAIGVVVGAALHAGTQFIGLQRLGLRLRLALDRSTEGFHQVLRLMGPRIIGQAAFQVNFIVMTNFASREGTASVGALNYAFQLFSLPYGVLALSLSTVIFPILSRLVQLGSLDAMKRTLSNALAPLLFLSLPAAILLYTFRLSIVQVLFQIGSFDAESTELVAGALKFFALGLIGWAITEALTRAFYAMHDTRTPVIISTSAVVINVALSWWLLGRVGYQGLALSLSISSSIEALALFVVLSRVIGMPDRRFWASLGRTVAISIPFVVVAYWIGDNLGVVTDPDNGRSIGAYLLFGFGLGTAGLTYAVLAYVAGSPEVPMIASRIPVLGRKIKPFVEARYPRSGNE